MELVEKEIASVEKDLNICKEYLLNICSSLIGIDPLSSEYIDILQELSLSLTFDADNLTFVHNLRSILYTERESIDHGLKCIETIYSSSMASEYFEAEDIEILSHMIRKTRNTLSRASQYASFPEDFRRAGEEEFLSSEYPVAITKFLIVLSDYFKTALINVLENISSVI